MSAADRRYRGAKLNIPVGSTNGGSTNTTRCPNPASTRADDTTASRTRPSTRPPTGHGRDITPTRNRPGSRTGNSRPVNTSSNNAASATDRVIGPATDNPVHTSSCGANDTRPRCGFNPNNPVAAAGNRIDPPPSEPNAADTNPAATAAAAPPLDPPGENSRSHGLRVTPPPRDCVNGHRHNSGARVRPTTTAPAARNRATTSASRAATRVTASVPDVVGNPSMSVSSFTATATPSNGPSPPAARRASAAAASSRARCPNTNRNAFNPGSNRAIRSRHADTNPTDDTRPARNNSNWPVTPAKHTSTESMHRP